MSEATYSIKYNPKNGKFGVWIVGSISLFQFVGWAANIKEATDMARDQLDKIGQ